MLFLSPDVAAGSGRTGHEGPEEDLFRRSDIQTCYDVLTDSGVYPLAPSDVVYFEGISVFREEEHRGYAYAAVPYEVDAVGVAASGPADDGADRSGALLVAGAAMAAQPGLE